ncbi:5-methyltetrahydrofolate--homocysteine methyltransferase [Paraglaciecola sp. 2405UD69-4]|uniref:5-methyltetrahydrofolate--homocysteine methyltransferase n=1 Tax=Paraglaciecola sp. 2405UD69-4 TaxID=3391836 RepID=UPI0039C97F9E
MKRIFFLSAIASALLLTGCGDATTDIVELESIEITEDEDDHDHDSEYEIESEGRLVVSDAASDLFTVFDLDTNESLDSFSSTFEGSSLSASAGYRYAVINNRSNDLTEFLDGGLWREDHVEHLHDYEQDPAFSDFTLIGSSPTHVITHDGQLAVFYDGDADLGIPSAVQVVTDTQIASEITDVPTLDFTINMHGVAEPRGDMLITSVRRDDAETLSAATILPDSVAVYHLHDDEYELEQSFDGECADLHGAAQNETAVAFGCGDGVLLLLEDDEVFSSSFIENIDVLDGVRVGSMYGHEHNEAFVGVASSHDGVGAILVSISPTSQSMGLIDWQASEGASPVAYGFSYEGEYLAILDNLGYVTLLEEHDEDGDVHWEFSQKIDVANASAAELEEGESFAMTASQHEEVLFITNPVSQQVLSLSLDDMQVSEEISLDFTPAAVVWLGIAEDH